MSQTLVIPKVAEIHANESTFLFIQKEQALRSQSYNINDVMSLEQRLSAQLEGLKLGGEISWEFCEELLAFEEPGEIFSAAFLAIEQEDLAKLNSVFEVAAEYSELLDAIASALIWLPYEKVAQTLESLLSYLSRPHRYVAISSMSGHQQFTSNMEQATLKALESDDVLLLYKAISAISESSRLDLAPKIHPFMEHEDENIQFAANWGATRFGHAEAMENLKAFVGHPVYHEKAQQYVVMQKDLANTVGIVKQLLSDESTARYALSALAYLGNPKSIPQIISLMNTPELARMAGYAFSSITGVDLEMTKMDVDEPEGFQAGPTENPEDEDVAMDPDEDLPWPNVKMIAEWWKQNQGRFVGAERYILGQPMSKTQFKQVLRIGNQKQRAFAANCLGAYDRNEPIFNVFAPAKRQMQLLGM